MYHNIKKLLNLILSYVLGLDQTAQIAKEYKKWIVRYPRASISNFKIL
jgi:hypothetical protein